MVSKYYSLARAGDDPIQSLKSVNRYSIHALTQSGHKDSDKFNRFVENVNNANTTAFASIKFYTFVNIQIVKVRFQPAHNCSNKR